jgi:hypothetical protein
VINGLSTESLEEASLKEREVCGYDVFGFGKMHHSLSAVAPTVPLSSKHEVGRSSRGDFHVVRW